MQWPRQTGYAGQRQRVLVAVCLQEGVTLLLLQVSEGWGREGDVETGTSMLYVNSTVKELRRLFLVQDLVDSLKVRLLQIFLTLL